jgi:DNA transformation protein and related proteins
MATAQGTVDVILEAIGSAGAVSAKKMFGEYGVYCDGKMIGSVSDDQFFVKITEAGRAWLGDAVDEAPPYPGAKPNFRVGAERWDDAEWMGELVRVTWGELPVGKPKAKK